MRHHVTIVALEILIMLTKAVAKEPLRAAWTMRQRDFDKDRLSSFMLCMFFIVKTAQSAGPPFPFFRTAVVVPQQAPPSLRASTLRGGKAVHCTDAGMHSRAPRLYR